MNIQILQLKEGASRAKGITVVIDVFRAFSLEAYLMFWGAEKIIPVGDEDVARKLKKDNPEFILAGERGGKILPGFDTGNSPKQAVEMDVFGKTVVQVQSFLINQEATFFPKMTSICVLKPICLTLC